MGRGGGVVAGRAPSQAAYYVALAGVATLLLMLCCYFVYFCITKINELSDHESLCGGGSRARAAPPARDSYPVQPVVRDSATAMAKLCRELPRPGGAGTVGATGTVEATAPPAAPRAEVGATIGSLASATTLSEDTATTGDSAGS